MVTLRQQKGVGHPVFPFLPSAIKFLSGSLHMANFKARCLVGLSIVVLVVTAFFSYREYQRTAVTRYFQSQSFMALVTALPNNTETDTRVTLSVDSSKVTVRVDARTQEEFDRFTQLGRRPGRSSLERLIIVWKGVEHQF
jgi:hypothetical protein